MIENINVGSQANSHDGDKLRNAFIKVNDNFDYIQSVLDTCLIQGSIEISDINGLQSALDNIQDQLDYIPVLQNQIYNISNSISSLNNSVLTINDNIISINADLLSLQSTINNLSNDIFDIQSDISNIQNELLNKIDDAPIDGISYIRKDAEWVNVNTYTPSLKNVIENGGDNIITNGSMVFSNLGFSTFISNVQFRVVNTSGAYTEMNAGNVRLRNMLGLGGDAYIRNGGTANNVNFYLPAKQTGGYTFSTIDDLVNFVPYTGATKNVDLGIYGLTATSFQFTGLTNSGRLTWNDTDGTADLTLKGGNVTLQIGQENVLKVVNKTATNITLLESNYQAVRVTGAQGNRLKVDLAQATTDALSAETIGLVTETILNNQEGFITTSGLVRNINTTGSLQGETWADGDMLYLSPTVAGRLTKIKPVAPQHLVVIGYVVRAHVTQGQIFVKVDNGYELDELHNVSISGTPSNNQALIYNSTTNVWENKSITQSLGYIPLPTTAGTASGTTLSFITDKVYGTIASPITGNITADVTSGQLGVTNIVIHNSATVPTFSSQYKRLTGSSNYLINNINYIFCTYINNTEIIYSINQRT